MNKRVIALLGLAALAVPAAATADPGHGRADAKPAGGHFVKTDDAKPAGDHVVKANGKRTAKPVKTVTFIFKGTFTADGAVKVISGNAHVRKRRFVGQTVRFDFGSARVVVADTNADQKADLADVKVGDVVLVKAKLSRARRMPRRLMSRPSSHSSPSSSSTRPTRLLWTRPTELTDTPSMPVAA